MTVFKQGDNYMVSTASKGTRAVEDLVRQFAKDDLPFEVADGTVTRGAFDPSGKTLRLVLTDPRTGNPVRFDFTMTRK